MHWCKQTASCRDPRQRDITPYYSEKATHTSHYGAIPGKIPSTFPTSALTTSNQSRNISCSTGTLAAGAENARSGGVIWWRWLQVQVSPVLICLGVGYLAEERQVDYAVLAPGVINKVLR